MTDDLKARGVRAEKQRRNALAHHEQQAEAEASCVPCKLCGGKAVIRDAGPGWGYYIKCENAFDSMARGRGYCLQSGARLSGWAYNCSDMWNRLNATPAALSDHPAVKALVAEAEARGMERAAEMIMPYIRKMFDVVIYEGVTADGAGTFPVPFADFGIGVAPEDAHALGIQMTHKNNRWSGLSYARNDEMRDTEEAVLKKALAPLEATIRAEAAAIRKG